MTRHLLLIGDGKWIRWRQSTPLLLLAACLTWQGVVAASDAPTKPSSTGKGKAILTVRDKKSGQTLPCRIHLHDAAGKPQRAGAFPFWNDHFVCDGNATVELAPGRYSYEVERGPEYSAARGAFLVPAKDSVAVTVTLERLAELAAEGWWPGDLHVHRAVEDIELLMRAEDLHIAPVITWHNGRSRWTGQGHLPTSLLRGFDGNRYYHLMAGEDEREGGALLYFNLPRPLPLPGDRRSAGEYPSPLKYVALARQYANVWIDVEKPFWWDVPVWLASGQIDSVGLANNHMCRSRMMDQEAWGKPRDTQRLPPPLGNGLWSQEIYYHILNSGLRLPPSAGSASGFLPNPLGYNRVYVHVATPLRYDKWWDGLRAGRCFVTNGPLLRVTADGRLPGHVFTAPQDKEVRIEIKAQLTSRDPIRVLEIIKNGHVEAKVPFAQWRKTGSLGTLTFRKSGWFLVRVIADYPATFRFASTGPYYVEIGATKNPIRKASAQFFLNWVREREKRIKLEDRKQLEEVLQHHQAAEKFWQDRVAAADNSE